MDSSAQKDVLCKYFDARKLMEMYMGEESCFRDDTFMQLVPVVVKIFSSGAIKGDMLIGIAIAPFLHLTLPGTEYFKEIIFASTNDKSNLELLKWLQNEPDAFNWSGAAKVMCELEGKGNTWMEKQMALRQKIKQVLSCDVTKGNPFSPVLLPQADCLLLPHYIDVNISDKKSFCSVLKNISSLLKVGGHIVIMMGLETTFYMVGTFRFPHVFIEADFLKKCLIDIGYVIVEQHIVKRKVEYLLDVTDYNSLIVINARKEK